MKKCHILMIRVRLLAALRTLFALGDMKWCRLIIVGGLFAAGSSSYGRPVVRVRKDRRGNEGNSAGGPEECASVYEPGKTAVGLVLATVIRRNTMASYVGIVCETSNWNSEAKPTREEDGHEWDAL